MTSLADYHFDIEDDTRRRRKGRAAHRPTIVTVRPHGRDVAQRSAAATRFHDLTKDLEGDWFERPSGLDYLEGSPVLIFPEKGEIEIADILSRPLDVSNFLQLAIGMAEVVRAMHQAGIIHRSLTPSAFLLNRVSGRIRLTGFDLASVLPQEMDGMPADALPRSSFPYMAPEQTGRTNRIVDSRSDLYSLGAIFYEMLTGIPPFQADNVLDWVHFHVAAAALPPSELVDRIPGPISDVVVRLLSKSPVERYQSAEDLERDLRSMLESWNASGSIDTRVRHDAASQGLPHGLHRLQGRERELGALKDALTCAREGSFTTAVLSGRSGMGKSSLVRELRSEVGLGSGTYAEGKFDQQLRQRPYSALREALRSLVSQALVERSDRRSSRAERVIAALGTGAPVAVELVENLDQLVGSQADVQPVPAADPVRQLHDLLIRLIGSFASPEEPLVLFLDDLQWSDDDTISVLRHMRATGGVPNVLIVMAYRSEDVGDAHPAWALVSPESGQGSDTRRLVHIEVDRLPTTAIAEIVEEVLGGAFVDQQLIETVDARSDGNPFFALQFLSALMEGGLVVRTDEGWSYDATMPRSVQQPASVTQVVARRLGGLPSDSLYAIVCLACLGHAAEDATLALAMGMSITAVERLLAPAVTAGLLELAGTQFAFAHDRVQEAAYSSMSPAETEARHLAIGRRLLDGGLAERRSDGVFTVLGQLGTPDRLSLDVDRCEFARLSLDAALRMKRTAAFPSALRYLANARRSLSDDDRRRFPQLDFGIGMATAECEFMIGHLADAHERLRTLEAALVDEDNRDALVLLHIKILTGMDRNADAVTLGLLNLARHGVDLPGTPDDETVSAAYSSMLRALNGRAIEDLAALPIMHDPAVGHVVAVLSELTAAASYVDENLLGLILLRIADLSMNHGNAPGTCFAYVCMNMVVGFRFDDYDAGYRFGTLALKLVEKTELAGMRPRALMCFGAMVSPWTHHVAKGRPLIEEAFGIAVDGGDAVFAAYARDMLVTNRFLCGERLGAVEREAAAALHFAKSAGIGLVCAFLESQSARLRALQRVDGFGYLGDGEFSEDEFEDRLDARAGLVMAGFRYWTQKMEMRLHAGLLQDAAIAAAAARSLLWTSPSFVEVADFYFFDGLLAATLADSAVQPARIALLATLEKATHAFDIWAGHGPANFLPRLNLLKAEHARLSGASALAEQLYEAGLDAAGRSLFVQTEGLIAEHAAIFYEARGLTRIRDTYVQVALDAYRRWGAAGKVASLIRRFPAHAGPAVPWGTRYSGLGDLDQDAIVASLQMLASEVDTQALIRQLMNVTLAGAGADHGVLVLLENGVMRVAAAARKGSAGLSMATTGNEPGIDYCMAAVSSVASSTSLLQVDDARLDDRLRDDPYVRSRQPRSLMAVPLLRQGVLMGVLQLENTHLAAAFTRAHLAVTELLATQAASSLETARLLEGLVAEVEVRRATEETLRRSQAWLAAAQAMSHTGSWRWDVNGDRADWSEEQYRILGVQQTDAPASLAIMAERIHADDRTRVLEDVAAAVAAGSGFGHEFRIVRPDGTVRHVVGIGEPESDDRSPSMIGTLMDVTDRKIAEDAVRQTQADLAHAARLAMVGELASGIIHEINQPLAASVVGANAAVRWLDRVVPDLTEAKAAMRDVSSQVKLAADIIDGLRNLSRKGETQAGPVNVQDAFEEVMPLLNIELRKGSASLEAQFDGGPLIVLIQRVQLQQVLVNLCRNAVEAMADARSPVRRVIVHAAASDGEIQISVSDTGPGVEVKSMARIFEPLFTTKLNGMGIGLAICRSIIAAHHGRLWLDQVGDGASFRISLPLGEL